jgi:diguanylate cyclase (GGDEF)-like protein/PAS domain S-box-containing protein
MRCALLTGASLTLLGLAVMGAWLTKTAIVLQILPGAAAMRFNAAALFLCVGIGLIALAWQRHRAVISLGLTVFLLAAFTATQDVLAVDLGIDNCLLHDWSGIGPTPSGRMAVNTGFCFMLTGLSLASLGYRGKWRLQPLVEGVAGSVVAAVGLATAVGYFSGIEAAYGWGGSIGMAFHTGLAFVLCGVTLIRLAMDHERAWSEHSPKWLPLTAAMLVVTVSLVYWQALRVELPRGTKYHTVVNATLAMGLLRALVFALMVYYYQQSRRQLRLTAQAAEALHESQRRFRAIFDQTFQFIGLMSTQGILLEANRTALAFAGLSESDVVGKPFWETAWWTHDRELQNKLRDAVARASHGEFIRFEATHPDREGELHVVDFSLKPVRDEGGRVVMLIPEGRDITEQKHAEVELIRLARQDRLTGLPNRSLLMERLQHVVAQSQARQQFEYGFLFLDFDRFKFVNDTLGHRIGDELLKAIASRLKAVTKPLDSLDNVVANATAARMGGDEFVVLLPSASRGQILELTETLLTALSEPYHLAGREVHSTASIGVVIGDAHYHRAEEVIRDADAAMYAAKHAGKARYVEFDAQMRAAFHRRLQLENDLRGAIERHEMALAYQPVLSLATGEIQSVEVLARWRHPMAGEIDPAEFVPIAEESDLIHTLSDWVLTTACEQMVQWQHDLGASAPAIISLNLSYKQFRDPRLLTRIQQVLEQSGLKPECLQFEIGEAAFASDEHSAQRIAQAIRGFGIQLIIDDFGTGSASLASVHRYPVDAIKVNRSMLADLETSQDSAALIHALAVLVRNIGVSMVADGVETFAQAAALQKLGCGFAQGHFLARPLSAAEFEQFAPRHGGIMCEAQGAMAFAHRWSDTMVLTS